MLLTMEPGAVASGQGSGGGVVFGVQTDVPQNGGNAAQRREHDKRIGAGTMSRTGATCPCYSFARFALPITWDYAEGNPFADSSGGFAQAIEWIGKVLNHISLAVQVSPEATVLHDSAMANKTAGFDAIVTDPPYYDAIPYSDLMDFFYIWLRRTLGASNGPFDAAFNGELGPKWNRSMDDGELIDDASRFNGDKALSKKNYEDGMARAFQACHAALQPDGRLVVVFANKQPDAWETRVAALVRAGSVVDGSWPIQTERQVRTRSLASAALASSVWLVCKKRPPARPGWDNTVLNKMRENITQQLHDFWDAGIRGPDFVWAATRRKLTITSIRAASSATPCSVRFHRRSSNWPTPAPTSAPCSKL